MFTLFRVSVNVRFCLLLTVVGILSLSIIAPAAPSSIDLPSAYPPDPGSDLAWSAGFNGVADIQTAFNSGRTNEGGSLQTMTLPSQAAWDGMNDNDKALWMINNERKARSVHLLHGYESNVISVAQNFAEYMLTNDTWGHYSDGKGPTVRLGENPTIAGCHDGGLGWENIASFASSASIPLPIERAIYNWMYDDSSKGWGHRHMLLYYPYNENSGPTDREGFIGIGRASGPYTIGKLYDFGEVIVLNTFDPCVNWKYTAPPPTPREYFLPLVCK